MRGHLALLVFGSVTWMGCIPYIGPPPRHIVPADARSVGCLAIAVAAPRDPVLAFDIANSCPYPVAVEFRNVVVRAWSYSGTEYRPAACDPRGELFQAQLDGHDSARVVLSFPVPVPTPRFCVDVARLNVDRPAPQPLHVWFLATGDGSGGYV